MPARFRGRRKAIFVAPILMGVPGAFAQQIWTGFGNNPQHTADSSIASDQLQTIRWTTPVDLNPDFYGSDLYIHYGSPEITAANTVVVPVKTGLTNGFEVEGLNGTTGATIWTAGTDYSVPPAPPIPSGWIPSYQPTLTPSGGLYYAGAGGTVYYRDSADSAGSATQQIAFFGNSNYTADESAYNNDVFIDTPITSDAAGDVYFGFRVTGSTPIAGLTSGIARIAANGSATYTSIAAADPGNSNVNTTTMNCAPAISANGSDLYVTVSTGASNSGTGDLIELNAATLAPMNSVHLTDPRSGSSAYLPDDGTASPMIGPDGNVYIGVLENPLGSNHYRGWLLQYSSNLSQTLTPGAFGWDDTPSEVPASMIPWYKGPSKYLLMAKYNNYAEAGGNGINQIAILDPNATMIDPVTGETVMKTVETLDGLTPDPDADSYDPGAVKEWCINSAAVDPATDSILVGSEDGNLYRWNLASGTVTQTMTLTSGLGEAYTPTEIGADGAVYAINDATLFSVAGAQSLTWDNSAGGDGVHWDTNNQNWTIGAPATYADGANVTFGDNNNGNYAVTLNGVVSPGSVTFTNSQGNYVISGTGGISGGGALTVAGAGTVTLSTSNTYTGGTNVISGELIIAAAASLPAKSAVTIGTAGTTGEIALSTTGGTFAISALTINTGSTLDVGGNTVILSYGANDPISTIQAYLASGEIVSSAVATANASQSALVYAIGYADGADGVVSGLNSGQIEIMPTLAGDAKLQENVNFGDFQILVANFGSSGSWDQGNFTYGSLIDFGDFQLLAQNFGANANEVTAAELASLNGFASQFGKELMANPGGSGYSLVSVPEPASMGLVALGGLGLRWRRRRITRAFGVTGHTFNL